MPKINEAKMTGTELKAIRESLSYSLWDMAKLFDMPNYQQLQKYENGTRGIPEDIQIKALQFLETQRKHSAEICDSLVKKYKNFDTEDFYLILQPSHPEDNAGIRKAYIKMLLKGQPVHLVHLDKDSYTKFREDMELEHNEKTMQLWAHWYYKNQLYLKRKNIIPKEPPRNMFRWQEEIHEWERED